MSLDWIVLVCVCVRVCRCFIGIDLCVHVCLCVYVVVCICVCCVCVLYAWLYVRPGVCVFCYRCFLFCSVLCMHACWREQTAVLFCLAHGTRYTRVHACISKHQTRPTCHTRVTKQPGLAKLQKSSFFKATTNPRCHQRGRTVQEFVGRAIVDGRIANCNTRRE